LRLFTFNCISNWNAGNLIWHNVLTQIQLIEFWSPDMLLPLRLILKSFACEIALQKDSWKTLLLLAYQSLGVVYGDLSTSPLYVYKSTFAEDIQHSDTNEEIFGVLSFVFWTLTLVPLFKYVFVVLRADDNGEGKCVSNYAILYYSIIKFIFIFIFCICSNRWYFCIVFIDMPACKGLPSAQ